MPAISVQLRLPLCSIIIPTYNHGEYIARSIECSLAQTYPNIEIIVVDDGSTDDTPERVKKFGDRIKYIRKQQTGRGDSRNRALIESSGKYVQFLDADDTIEADKLASQVPVLEEDENIAVVYSDCSSNDHRGVEGENVSYPLRDDEDPIPILLLRTLFGIHAGMTRRDAIINVGMFDPHPLAQEDWDLWLKLALQGYRYRYLPGDLAHYDQRGSTTVVNSRLMYQRTSHMLEKYLNDPIFSHLDDGLKRRFTVYQNLHLATRSYNNGWWRRSRDHVIRAVTANPRLVEFKYWKYIPKTLIYQMAPIAPNGAAAEPEIVEA